MSSDLFSSLPFINTTNEWVASAEEADFVDTTDTYRYSGNPIKEGESATSTAADNLTNSTSPSSILDDVMSDMGIDSNMIEATMNELQSSFSGVSGSNRSEIVSMIADSINTKGGIGASATEMAQVKKSISTLCGNFDASIFGNFNGMNIPLFGFGLASLLTSLLCMGVDSAVKGVKDVLDGSTYDNNLIKGVVDNALDGLGISNSTAPSNAIANGVFKSTTRTVSTNNLNIESMLDDIVADATLTATFKNTNTSSRLIANYNGDSSKVTNYMNTLLPNWSVADLAATKNAGNNILKNKKNIDLIDEDIVNTVSAVTKEDYMMLV